MPSAPLPDFDDDMGSVLLADMSVDDYHRSSLDPTAGSSFHASEDSADDNDCSEFTDDEENPPGSVEKKHPVDQEKYIVFEQNLEGLWAAILLSGGLFSTFFTFASLLNLAFIGGRTFYYIQKQLLCPVVHHA